MSISDKIRQEVRERASKRCEYCRRTEHGIAFPFHVDHIIAQKHDGSSDLSNLAWSCFQCNIFKGTDIASYDRETGDLTPFYNPRTQNWEDHFEMDGIYIKGKTAIGLVLLGCCN